MKWTELWQMSLEGHWEAERLELDKQANWTPLLVYLHTSRMVIGFAFGAIIGCFVGAAILNLILT